MSDDWIDDHLMSDYDERNGDVETEDVEEASEDA